MVQAQTCDLLVLGAGGGGLAGALAARERGLDCLVLEASEYVGGSTALSGGTMWLPATRLQGAAGVSDSAANARRYLDQIVDEAGPWCDAARRDAFISAAPELEAMLERAGLKLYYADGWTDYYADLEGGVARGRTLGARPFDARSLGEAEPWLRPSAFPLPANSVELSFLALAGRTWRSRIAALRVGARVARAKFTGERFWVRGQSLIGQMLAALGGPGAPVWRNTHVRALIVRDGRVCGAVAEREGREIEIEARRGVLMTLGGYARNPAVRAPLQHGINGDWSLAAPSDLGDGLALGKSVGAAVAGLDEAWWAPCSRLPTHVVGHVWDRCFPYSMIVDKNGDRYMNEAAPYMEAGQTMIAHAEKTGAMHSWLLLERRHRERYVFGGAMPGRTPETWISRGYMARAETIEQLAREIDVDPVRLRASIDRFNGFARQGRDEDFSRGDLAFGRYYADHSVTPNGNLGPLEQPPFYAIAVFPGDVGTAGGLVADANARVRRDDGKIIEGLYAAGNCAAPVFGATYPGAGASIAASMVFAMRAAQHAAKPPAGANADA